MYQARELLKLSTDNLWKLPLGPMQLQFDDEIIQTTGQETIFSAYLWEYHRLYPTVPLLAKHHMNGSRLGADTHLKILGFAMFDAYDHHLSLGDLLDMEHLQKVAYQVTNKVFLDFTDRCMPNVTGISILDFIEAADQPEIAKANQEIQPNQLSIGHAYDTIGRVLKDPDTMRNNPIARAAKSGLVSMGQINQCLGPRGFLTSINSTQYPKPVLRSYLSGFRSIHDSMVESCSAGKALMMAKDPLAESEYFNRQMQLLACVLKNLHPGDCGTKATLAWRVRGSDLKTLAGKHYVTPEGLKTVKVTDRHLVGELIQMRAISKCIHPDIYGKCAVCFGDLSLSIPAGTNIGHVSTTVLCAILSQVVLSTKHLDNNATINAIYISEHDQHFISVGIDENTIRLAKPLAGKKVALVIASADARNLGDIAHTEDVFGLSISRLTNIRDVTIEVDHGDGSEIQLAVVAVAMGSRISSLSHDMLNHVKCHGWTLSPTGDLIIDLTNWDHELPIFELPLKHLNMLDFMSSIESMVKSSTKSKKSRSKSLRDFATVEIALVEFHDLVMSKKEMSINIAHLEIIIASTMITSKANNDHSLPAFGTPVEFGSYGDNMHLRSMAGLMAFQSQAAALIELMSYTVTDRLDSPMDNLLMG